MNNLLTTLLVKGKQSPSKRGIISYGEQKADGSHDHRTSRGGDRTAAQKAGDAKRTKK